MNPSIIWLEEALAQQPAIVGSKAAMLSRLATGYNVPPGFCVVFELPLQRHGGFVDALQADLLAAYTELAGRFGADDMPVAVRSSAVGEDGEETSFAGQYRTLLNVQGADALVEAVQRCVASAGSPRARAYRAERGLEGEGAFTVLVQRMVEADVSVVAFSINPVTGAHDEVLINTSWGLGESLVSGLVTPDSFTVRKQDRGIVSSYIAHKEYRTALAARGTRQISIPDHLREIPSLAEEQIVEVAGLCMALETRFGFPVDLECAYQDGTLFLLQCRPVTAF
jgi:phosphoenolpyruvate synthase/pyruvate phosphate dikinase